MGMESYILAIGKYRDMPNSVLEYPDDYYVGVADSTVVIGRIGECRTTDKSIKFADSLGIDAWDFNQFHISELPDLYTDDEDIEGWLIEIKHCLHNGIDLYFMPNA